jgi:hypothetical protein
MEIDGIRVGSRARDLRGLRFGKLTVDHLSSTQRGLWWACRCDCGSQSVVFAASLLSGNTTTCGCLKRDILLARNTTHGQSRTPEYQAWNGIITRTENADRSDYANYGGRGIKMCARWRHGEDGKSGFECFLADMGPRPSPGHSIDRIDVEGHYEAGNCRWATKREQMGNKRNNVYVEIAGERRLGVHVAAEHGITPKAFQRRYSQLGWSVEDAATMPMAPRRA